MKPNTNLAIIVLAIIIGLTINGYFIGRSIQRFKTEDRSISVKGFAEREVKSDFAVWTIKTRITSNDINEGGKTIDEKKSKIISFLKSNGFADNEIIQQRVNVTDKLAKEYGTSDLMGFRYIIENVLQVRSKKVDLIEQVSKQTDKLLKAGVIISEEQEYNPSVSYIYSGLNDIKPKMLSEAVQNAKKAAEQFTKDSQVNLGALKRASQGLFSITDRDAANRSANEGAYQSSANEVYKKVRVVVNVEYALQ